MAKPEGGTHLACAKFCGCKIVGEPVEWDCLCTFFFTDMLQATGYVKVSKGKVGEIQAGHIDFFFFTTL